MEEDTAAGRMRVIREAHAAGLPTVVMFGPLLPFLSDGQESLDGLFAWAADAGVDWIWTDALNPRPRVWEAVAELLRREYPDLPGRYGNILFDPGMREAYRGALRERVQRAAERAGVRDRLVGCA